MSFPVTTRQPLTPDLQICPVLNGLWQVSGAHGPIDPQAALQSMVQYVDAGFITWDLADHYGPAEDFIGMFRRQMVASRGPESVASIQAFTKWVPRPAPMTRQVVESNIDRSLKRMGVDTLDLLQFHWWDYRDLAYLDALRHMVDLQKEGKIKHLALTNFDTEHLQIIVEQGIPIVSNQVQFSLIDRRPLVKMVEFCQQHNIKLLAYGTLGGGLLSERYLNKPEPKSWDLNTASLRKYKNMLDTWGGWAKFQQLLQVVQSIAVRHQVSIGNVAVRYVLDQPTVVGAIVGARLGVSEHLQDNAQVLTLQLDQTDTQALDAVLSESRDLFKLIGDCGDEYRR